MKRYTLFIFILPVGFISPACRANDRVSDQGSDEAESETAVIKYPQPIEITGSIGPKGTWGFLLLYIQPADTFRPITVPAKASTPKMRTNF